MTNYGRNFEFAVSPEGRERKGRFYNAEGSNIPIGVPVVRTAGAANALDLAPVALATGDQAIPDQGTGGIAVYEHAPNAFAGYDPVLTTYSDIDFVPNGKACQVVSGTAVKVRLINTVARTYLQTTAYPGRVMVAGVSIATPTVAVGDMLTPGVGNDTDGYWAETGTAANAWLIVTKVDTTRDEVEAQMSF